MRIGHISEIDHFVTDADAAPRACTASARSNDVVLDVAIENGHEGTSTRRYREIVPPRRG